MYKMSLESNANFSNSSVRLASPFNYEKETCFLFDVNFNPTQYLYVAHILTSIINIAFSLTAVAGNFIVIYSVWKTRSLHTPSNVFLCSLAFSDLTVGFLAQPCFVIHKIGELLHRSGMYCPTRILLESLGNITAGASVLTMTGIAVERCLALYFHLRYNEIVTSRRVLSAVACIWIVFIVLAAFRISLMSPAIYNTISIAVISLSLLSTYLAYVKILRCVRKHERRIQIVETEVNSSSPQMKEKAGQLRNMLRYKKSTVAMIFVVGFFTICFLPYLCVKLAHKTWGYTTPVKTAYLYASTIAFLNSSFNPVIYCWRINSLRHAVKTVLKERLWKRPHSF